PVKGAPESLRLWLKKFRISPPQQIYTAVPDCSRKNLPRNANDPFNLHNLTEQPSEVFDACGMDDLGLRGNR
ncbi:MAG: hypothetical protein ACYSWW_12445, partial [Planctomycetota bacterium]